MSIRHGIYKPKIQKNGTGREVEGLDILGVKMAVHELAQRAQGMRRQKVQGWNSEARFTAEEQRTKSQGREEGN